MMKKKILCITCIVGMVSLAACDIQPTYVPTTISGISNPVPEVVVTGTTQVEDSPQIVVGDIVPENMPESVTELTPTPEPTQVPVEEEEDVIDPITQIIMGTVRMSGQTLWRLVTSYDTLGYLFSKLDGTVFQAGVVLTFDEDGYATQLVSEDGTFVRSEQEFNQLAVDTPGYLKSSGIYKVDLIMARDGSIVGIKIIETEQ